MKQNLVYFSLLICVAAICLCSFKADSQTGAGDYSGLSLQTFTAQEEIEGYNDEKHLVYNPLSLSQMVDNLKTLGFSLVYSKKVKRHDYTGTETYYFTVQKFSKTINGRTTTVKLEEDYTRIQFPDKSDMDIFMGPIKMLVFEEVEENLWRDNDSVYWAGTDISLKDNTVYLRYRWEP